MQGTWKKACTMCICMFMKMYGLLMQVCIHAFQQENNISTCMYHAFAYTHAYSCIIQGTWKKCTHSRHTCMYLSIYVIYGCMYVCTYACMHIPKHTCMYIPQKIACALDMHAFTNVHTYTFPCTTMCMHTLNI